MESSTQRLVGIENAWVQALGEAGRDALVVAESSLDNLLLDANAQEDAHATLAIRSGKFGITSRPNMRIWSSISSTVLPTKMRPQRWPTPTALSASTWLQMSSGVPNRLAVMYSSTSTPFSVDCWSETRWW